MRKSLQILAMLLSLSAVMPAMADNTTTDETSEESGAARTATIRGRVLDSEHNILTGAVIYIEDIQAGAVSDVNGYYTISNVTPGEHTVEVSYIGYEPGKTQVNVAQGETLKQEIVLADSSTRVDEVVVTSVMQGQHRALNTQKNALNMVDVVSADQAGKYPDSNIGDALKRISGINVQYDQGEARFGQVRGTPADMSSVTINGTRLPSAEGETRSVQLDLIPTDMIQTIEVSKVVTPDMEADAIGGSINLVTKNSPSKEVLTASLGSGYSMVSGRPQANVGVTYGNKLSDKFGFMLSGSYQNNPIGSDNTEFEWSTDDDDKAYIKEMQIRQYYVQRERQSYSAAFNWNINDNHKIDFKGIYNRRNDWENRYKTKVKLKDDGSLKELGIETKAGTEDQKYGRLEQQQTMAYTLGGEHLFGKVMLDWGATVSAASEDRPNESYIAFAFEGEEDAAKPVIGFDFADKQQPTPVHTEYLTLNSIMRDGIGGEFGKLDELSRSQQEIQENDYTGHINLKYNISSGDYGTTLKVGGKYTSKDKSVDVYCYEYKKHVGADFVDQALENTKIVDRKGFMQGEGYNFGREFVTREFVGDLDLDSFGGYEDKLSERANNYEANETVTAAYIRVDQKLGDKLSLMAGARAEHTSITNSGFQYIDEEEELEETGTKNSSYLNILPSVLLKWDPSNNLKVRASYTNSIARPKYSDLVNNIITDKDEEIKFGNPNLNASLSHNVDLSVDYYFKSLGLVRGGLFYKKINDFIVDQVMNDYDYAGITYDDYKKPVNAGNASLYGAEISLSRDFGFISPSLRSLGFATTYTYTHSDAELTAIEGREGEDMALPGSPEHTANASIYFEKKGFTARLSYNYASSFIDELGDEAFEDRYYDSVNYLDFNVNYRFKEHYNIYADVSNILNQPLRYYQGTKDQTMQSEFYGIRFNVGVKFNF